MVSLKDCRVLVTPTSYASSDATLRTDLEAAVGEVIYNPTGGALAADDLLPLVRGVDGWIAGLDEINHAVIEAADCLRVIARYGVGVDRVDLEAARRKGIIVTNTPGANAVSVAELTIGLMIALARGMAYADHQTKTGAWPRMKGTTLSGKTVGLLGLGAIGRRVASLLSGFNCTILGYDPFVDPEQAAQFGVQWLERDAVLRRADILSLHLPVTADTENMFNRDLFAQLKDGVYIVNTARSELIDDDAVIEALESGKLAGLAIDTFRREPPGEGHPLFQFPQVITTPHMGAHTDDSTNAMGRIALHDCLAVLRGEDPVYRVV